MSLSKGTFPKKENQSFFRVFLKKLRKKKIIETLGAFIGGGWLILEFVHMILIGHYHFPEKTLDIVFVSLIGALICAIVWRWFRETEDEIQKARTKIIIIPFIIFITVLLNLALLIPGLITVNGIFGKFMKEQASVVQPGQFVIAITPFYGPDEDSVKEGRVMAVLIENAIIQRLGKKAVKIIGIEETKESIRNHEAAKSLGERVGARIVIWGETFAVPGETEIKPFLTLITIKKTQPQEREDLDYLKNALFLDSIAAIQDRAMQPTVFEAEAPHQIELRRTTASRISDVVLLIAGIYSLYHENNAHKAISYFEKAQNTAECLRYKAEALIKLGKKDLAFSALKESTDLDPFEAQSYAFIGDIYMEMNRLKEAVAAYRAASQTNKPYYTNQAIFYDGKLYAKETYRSKRYSKGLLKETLYFIALDPESGKVLERYYLPGIATRFSLEKNIINITYLVHYWKKEGKVEEEDNIYFCHGKFDRKVYYPIYYLSSIISSRNRSLAIASNFLPDIYWISVKDYSPYDDLLQLQNEINNDAPRTLKDLESTLRSSLSNDSTQPWYYFLLAQSLLAQGYKADAEKVFLILFELEFPNIPYFEYSYMSFLCELSNQHEWADLAYEEALKRKKVYLPKEPFQYTTWFRRYISAPFLKIAAVASRNGIDMERQYLWLNRAREIDGICNEGDDFVAATWERYFRKKGEDERAEREAQFYRKAIRNPFNTSIIAKADYASYVAGAFLFGFLFLIIVVIKKAVELSIISNDFHIKVFPKIHKIQFIKNARALPGWIIVVAAMILAAFIIYSIILSYYERGISIIFAIWLYPLIAVFIIINLPLLKRITRNTPRKARFTLLFALTCTLISMFWYFSEFRRYDEILTSFNFGKSTSDILGHSSVVHFMEDKLKRMNVAEIKYVTAAVNHMAGNTERARALYQTLPKDPRAKENLSALQKGELYPPIPLSIEDLYKICIHSTFNENKDIFLSFVEEYKAFLFDAPNYGYIIMFIIMFALVFPNQSKSIKKKNRSISIKIRKFFSKCFYYLIPGNYDMHKGSIIKGWLTFMLLCFAVFSILACVLFSFSSASPGGYSDSVSSLSMMPIPWSHSLEGVRDSWEFFSWDRFWFWPYAKVFWSIVLLSAILSLSLHISRFRRIWRS